MDWSSENTISPRRLCILTFGIYLALSSLARADEIKVGANAGLNALALATHVGLTVRSESSPWLLKLYKSWDKYKLESVGAVRDPSHSLDLMFGVGRSLAVGGGLYHRKERCESESDSNVLRQEVEWVGLKVMFGGFSPVSSWGLFTYDLVGYAKPLRIVRRSDLSFGLNSGSGEEVRAELEKKIDERVADGVVMSPGVMFGLEF